MRHTVTTFHPAGQRGQASVFVLALLGVVILCAVFLYQAGRITSDKMQLQNAADAAAYGASVLEARSLNFAAYTNRAMVANEVAVGQFVGMLSWADELATAGEYAEIYQAALEAIGTASLLIPGMGEAIEAVLTVLGEIVGATGDTLTAVGEIIERALDLIAPPAIRGLSLINQVYSISQKIYHGTTYVLLTKNLYQSLEDNVLGVQFNRSDIFKKDLGGPQLSDLGVIALAGHLPSYWSGYTKIYSASASKTPKKKKKKKEDDKKKDDKKKDDKKKDDKKKDDKKKKKKKKKSPGGDGMARLAATIREARDPYTSGERDNPKNRSWNIELGFNKEFSFNTVLLGDFTIGIDAAIGGESRGGSELRKKNSSFAWTATDTLGVGTRAAIWGSYTVPIVDKKITLGKVPLALPMIPFGGGGVQAPGKAEDMLLPTDLFHIPGATESMYGKRAPEVYGGSLDYSHVGAVPGAAAEMEEDPLETYQGLQPYRDMAKLDEKKPGRFGIPFQAPYFLVGLTWPLSDITGKGPRFAGHLDLAEYDDDNSVDHLGVIAKSQLYFSRPTNLDYFLRKDKEREKPNVFGPFWQARLVDTTDAERFLALAMQQKTVWLTAREKSFVGGSVLDTVLGAVDDILEAVSNVLDRIIRLFL